VCNGDIKLGGDLVDVDYNVIYTLKKTIGSNSYILGPSAHGAGNYNITVGPSNGNSTTTGANNLLLGVTVGTALTNGWNNAMVGISSGRTTTSGSYNAYFGNNSGLLSTSGSYNVAIGSNTSVNSSYQIAIGSGAVATVANQCVIGSTSLTQFQSNGFRDLDNLTNDIMRIGKTNATKVEIGNGLTPTIIKGSLSLNNTLSRHYIKNNITTMKDSLSYTQTNVIGDIEYYTSGGAIYNGQPVILNYATNLITAVSATNIPTGRDVVGIAINNTSGSGQQIGVLIKGFGTARLSNSKHSLIENFTSLNTSIISIPSGTVSSNDGHLGLWLYVKKNVKLTNIQMVNSGTDGIIANSSDGTPLVYTLYTAFELNDDGTTDIASASSGDASNAFDRGYSGYAVDIWTSSINKYNSDTMYIGTEYTTVEGGLIYGEWVQIQLKSDVIISSVKYTHAHQTATFVLVFSMDGIKWNRYTDQYAYISSTSPTVQINPHIRTKYVRAIIINASGTVASCRELELFVSNPLRQTREHIITRLDYINNEFGNVSLRPSETDRILSMDSNNSVNVTRTEIFRFKTEDIKRTNNIVENQIFEWNNTSTYSDIVLSPGYYYITTNDNYVGLPAYNTNVIDASNTVVNGIDNEYIQSKFIGDGSWQLSDPGIKIALGAGDALINGSIIYPYIQANYIFENAGVDINSPAYIDTTDLTSITTVPGGPQIGHIMSSNSDYSSVLVKIDLLNDYITKTNTSMQSISSILHTLDISTPNINSLNTSISTLQSDTVSKSETDTQVLSGDIQIPLGSISYLVGQKIGDLISSTNTNSSNITTIQTDISTISNTVANLPVVSLTSAGGVNSLIADGTGPDLSVRGLTAGAGIDIISTEGVLTITNSSPASDLAGDITTIQTDITNLQNKTNGGKFAQYEITNINNTLAETSIIAGGEGSLTFGAGTLSRGDSFMVRCGGKVSTENATTTLTVRFKMNDSIFHVLHINNLKSTPAGLFNINLFITITSIGESGGMRFNGSLDIGTSNTIYHNIIQVVPFVINTTVDQVFNITATWNELSTSFKLENEMTIISKIY
jgi:hypothetical protein